MQVKGVYRGKELRLEKKYEDSRSTNTLKIEEKNCLYKNVNLQNMY